MDPPPPVWMLLDQDADVVVDDDDRGNATTAEADVPVRVSFFAADPPRLSHLAFHSDGIRGIPSVLQSVGDVALIQATFGSSFNSKNEYFLYKAGLGRRRPSLQHLTAVSEYLSGVVVVACVGFLPLSGDGGGDGFVLAALVYTMPGCHTDLHVFRSEEARLRIWNGMLVCDVLAEEPARATRFVPAPKVLPGNDADLRDQACGTARPFRDVALCSDGLKPEVSGEIPDDVWNVEVLQDGDLLQDRPEKPEEEVVVYEYDGWRVIGWSRALSSTCWDREFSFHADDIDADDTVRHAALCDDDEGEGGGGGGPAPSFAVKDLVTSYPTLGMDGKALYLISRLKKAKATADQEFVIKIDIGTRTLEEVSPILTPRRKSYRPNYMACDLCKYLNTDETLVRASSPPQDASSMVPSTPQPIVFPQAQRYSTPTSYVHYPCQQKEPQAVAQASWQQPSAPWSSAQHIQQWPVSSDHYSRAHYYHGFYGNGSYQQQPPPPSAGQIPQQPPPHYWPCSSTLQTQQWSHYQPSYYNGESYGNYQQRHLPAVGPFYQLRPPPPKSSLSTLQPPLPPSYYPLGTKLEKRRGAGNEDTGIEDLAYDMEGFKISKDGSMHRTMRDQVVFCFFN
ncbi:hypothetical protein ACP4OV_005261 [Aristida adscensionis]